MLYTIYSNSYEVLRACLIESFGTEGQRKPFEPIRIISGSRLINNELMLSIAREKGICSGFEFWTIDNWFFNYVGFGLGVGGHSQEFIWLLWRLLDDEFIGSHPRLCNYFKSHEQHINRDLLRYQLAKELASVFYKLSLIHI